MLALSRLISSLGLLADRRTISWLPRLASAVDDLTLPSREGGLALPFVWLERTLLPGLMLLQTADEGDGVLDRQCVPTRWCSGCARDPHVVSLPHRLRSPSATGSARLSARRP